MTLDSICNSCDVFFFRLKMELLAVRSTFFFRLSFLLAGKGHHVPKIYAICCNPVCPVENPVCPVQNPVCPVQNHSGFRDGVFRIQACIKSHKCLSFWNTINLIYLDLDWIHVLRSGLDTDYNYM